MDTSWISKPLSSKEYLDGVKNFIIFAREHSPYGDKILCPCLQCTNGELEPCSVVENHLKIYGFLQGYTDWFCHKEKEVPDAYLHVLVDDPVFVSADAVYNDSLRHVKEMRDMLNDALGMHNFQPQSDEAMDDVHHESEGLGGAQPTHEATKEDEEFIKLTEEADKPLYRDCTSFSKLSFIVRLFQMKCLNGWSGHSFTMLLELLNDAFPEICIPKSSYEIKKYLKLFDLGYEKIAACPKDCMLFTGDKKDLEYCETCGTSKWAGTPNVDQEIDELVRTVKKKKFAKILRYFPLIPRLRRLYRSSKTSSSMRWHDEGRVDDGVLRHPADAKAWKDFDVRYPDFALDPRSVRLGLASDGFNPFRERSSTYSIWPVVLIPYNLPPWECMKQSSFILSMIIPGDKGPGNDIDVYLQPLIDELQLLWEGVSAFDATANENFLLRASLMWTINDFPAYAMLSGYSTKGRYACPVCGEQTDSRWLDHSQKFAYMGHRRWLPDDHIFRQQAQSFNGEVECRCAPEPLSGSDVFQQLQGKKFSYGKPSQLVKKGRKRKRDEQAEDGDESRTPANIASWKRLSGLFKLPYWQFNSLPHNIDVMHVGKNVGERIVKLLMVHSKEKELKSRRDLETMKIRHHLHADDKGKYVPAMYTMSKEERDLFVDVFKDLKVPDGYASNLSRCISSKEDKLQSLKSHDYHILMQELLPVAVRSCLSDEVVDVLKELCCIYKELCSRVLNINHIDELERRAAMTLCRMEMIFPPSFFTVMVHLIIHLAREARLGGPVHYRWMYPIERYLCTLKGYVSSKSNIEANVAERRIGEEISILFSRHLHGVETRLARPERNPNVSNLHGPYLFKTAGRTIGKIDAFELDDLSWEQAHRYVLNHHASVEPFRSDFLATMKRKRRPKKISLREQNKLMNEQFHKWFETHVSNKGEGELESELKILAKGPRRMAKRYQGYIYNGYRFHIKDREAFRKSQNSGMVVTSITRSYASSKDNKPLDGDVDYYGVLTDIIDLDYYGNFRVVLFRGNWASVDGAKNKDGLGFTVVNFSHLIHTGEHISHEPFVFPSQVKQVYYVKDHVVLDSYVALSMQPRDGFQLGRNIDEDSGFIASEFACFDANS